MRSITARGLLVPSAAAWLPLTLQQCAGVAFVAADASQRGARCALGRDRFDELRSVVAYGVDSGADRMRHHQVRRVGREHRARLRRRPLEPGLLELTAQN